MTAVAGESVTMMKRSAPEQALKLKKQQEWKIYLEFIKVLFNLVDRLVGFYLPLKDRPEFMDSLEQAVAQQLKDVLAPTLGPEMDPMQVDLTIGNAVAESRQVYERFAFVVTEDSKARDDYFKHCGERIANLMGVSGNGMVISAATLCMSAVIPAIEGILKGAAPQGTTSDIRTPREPLSGKTDTSAIPSPPAGNEIKLISVMSSIEGEEVETRWGLHPRFRQDLKPDEVRELSHWMNRVTRILGERYAAVAFSDDWASWHQGHA